MSRIQTSIIVGAGHNGLVAANYLAKAGKKVLVLERRDVAGGQLATRCVRRRACTFDPLHAGGAAAPGHRARPRSGAARLAGSAASEPLHVAAAGRPPPAAVDGDAGDARDARLDPPVLRARCRALAGVRRVHGRRRRRSSTPPIARRCRACRTSAWRGGLAAGQARAERCAAWAARTCSA